MTRNYLDRMTLWHCREPVARSVAFSFLPDWVEKKIRRHMARARNRKGFGWKRWSTQWLYESLRLYNGYKVRWLTPKVAPAR
jgi:RNA-directed DNA polymerase